MAGAIGVLMHCQCPALVQLYRSCYTAVWVLLCSRAGAVVEAGPCTAHACCSCACVRACVTMKCCCACCSCCQLNSLLQMRQIQCEASRGEAATQAACALLPEADRLHPIVLHNGLDSVLSAIPQSHGTLVLSMPLCSLVSLSS